MFSTTTSQGRPLAADRGALLSRSISLDAVVSGASGLLGAACAALLDGVLGVSSVFLVVVGIFLLGYAAALALLAWADAPSPGVIVVIAGNALWALASVAAVLADWLTLTTAGTIVVLAQAAAVALLAEAQVVGLRRRGQSISL